MSDHHHLVPGPLPAIRRARAPLLDQPYSDDLSGDRARHLNGEIAGLLVLPDHLIGGENDTAPPSFTRGLSATTALLGQTPASTLARPVDVPWCKPELDYLEKLALTLSSP